MCESLIPRCQPRPTHARTPARVTTDAFPPKYSSPILGSNPLHTNVVACATLPNGPHFVPIPESVGSPPSPGSTSRRTFVRLHLDLGDGAVAECAFDRRDQLALRQDQLRPTPGAPTAQHTTRIAVVRLSHPIISISTATPPQTDTP